MFHLALLLVFGSFFTSTIAVINVGTTTNDGEIMIQDFANPTFDWETMTDQVMGGKSTSSLKVEDGVAHLTGKCELVPVRNFPGFVSLHGGQHWSWDEEDKGKNDKNTFPDLSRCEGVKLLLKSNVEYQGYHVDIGMRSRHVHGWGFKSHLLSVPKDTFGEITIPFNTFSINVGHRHDSENGATEDNVCSSTNKDACPDTETLCDMKSISIMGDAVGDIDLEVKSIRAFGCKTEGVGACLKKEEPSGNNRSMEQQNGNDNSAWKNTLWFAMGSVLTLAIGVYVLKQNRANHFTRFACLSNFRGPWSRADVSASGEAPAISANELA